MHWGKIYTSTECIGSGFRINKGTDVYVLRKVLLLHVKWLRHAPNQIFSMHVQPLFSLLVGNIYTLLSRPLLCVSTN